MPKTRKNDPTDVIHAILNLHAKHPQLRVGQMVANATREFYGGGLECDPFHVENGDLAHALEDLIKE